MSDWGKFTENFTSVHKGLVSVIMRKLRLEGTDFTSDIPTIIGMSENRELKLCSVRPALE